MASTVSRARYHVRRDAAGACYVIDRGTDVTVYGTYSVDYAEKRCDELNAAEPTPRRHTSPGNVHTVPYRGRWANVVEGEPQVVNTASSRSDAEALGREMAVLLGVNHVTHDHDPPGASGEPGSTGSSL